MPAPYEPADVSAFQAVADGRGTPEQQRRAVSWLINTLCATYDMSYRPGSTGERDTSFAEGRRFVGLQLVKLLHLNVAALLRGSKHG